MQENPVWVFPTTLAICCTLAVTSLDPTRSTAQPAEEPGVYASDHIVVRLSPAAMATLRAPREEPGRVPSRPEHLTLWEGDAPAGLSTAFERAWRRWQVVRMRPAYPYPFRNPQLARRYGLDRTYILDVPQLTDTGAMAAEFREVHEDIESAEGDPIGTVAEGLIPNDPNFDQQYNMHNKFGGALSDADIDGPEAWKIHTGDPGTVTVAVVDTGITVHMDLAGRVLPGVNMVDPFQDRCDGGLRDGLTCCPPSSRCDGGICVGGSLEGQPCCMGGTCVPYVVDLCPHGTHVAGVVGASSNNGVGVAGVTWGADLMPVKVFSGCSGTATNTANGIMWAADHGAAIINISLQFPIASATAVFEDAVDYAHDQGSLVVSAAGNNDFCGVGQVCWPARFANSMAVSGTTNRDEIATRANTDNRWSSNYGNEVDVAAPGDRIYSTWISPAYWWLDGTSLATPHVSGIAALLKSYLPSLTPDELRAIITKSAEDLGAPGWDPLYGFGRVSAYRALLQVAEEARILASLPPAEAVDARQPFHPDGSEPAGWQWIDMLMGGDTSQVSGASFQVTQTGGSGATPTVLTTQPIPGDYNVRVVLSRKISVGAWTTITHLDSGTGLRVGYLPGDVDASGALDGFDLEELTAAIAGVIEPLPDWATDLDRSGRLAPADLLREIDLMNGAEAFVTLSATLP